MSTRPWAIGLSRLLAERRGLKKGSLVPKRPGTISTVLHATKTPDIKTLQLLADALTRYDRLTNMNAPDVELWEFFVTDEQATVLRDRALKNRAESSNAVLLKQGAEMFAQFLKQQTQPVAAPTVVIVDTEPKRARRRTGR